MATKSRYRGHEIERANNKWYFCDSGEPVELNINIPCGHCGEANTKEGHDGCLGTLPRLMNACCGHGESGEAYAQFLDGAVVSGDSAQIVLTELKKIQSAKATNAT